MKTRFLLPLLLLMPPLMLLPTVPLPADDRTEPAAPAEPTESSPPPLIRLSKEHEVWVDPQRKLVVVNGVMAITDGPLEMFACPKGTKEHESLIAVNSSAQLVHAGLLAVGAVPGNPVHFVPEYKPASGAIIDIWVLWQDEDGKHRVRAQELVKNTKTNKAMEYDWVFGGSGFFTDEMTGRKYYHADGGDFICLSNFSSAMLDLPIESSQANDALLFTALTERVPPRGTKVRLVLQPRAKKKQDQKAGKAKQEPASDPKGIANQQDEE